MAHVKATSEALELVRDRFAQLQEQGVWPLGRRDLWTDALGLLTLLSLHRELGEPRFLSQAEWVAQEVDRILGRRRGICMGDRPDAQGQHFRSHLFWVFALHRLGQVVPRFRHRALDVVREIHAPFVRPGLGIISRMDEDLKQPFPGSGPGRLEAFLALAVYRQVGDGVLRAEIEELEGLVQATYPTLAPDHGVDLGLLLWIAHFFPSERWALVLRERALAALDARWVDPPGYFRRNLPEPWSGPVRSNRLALTNFTAAVGLQAQRVWFERVHRIHHYFLNHYPWEPDPEDGLAPLLGCVSLLPTPLLRD